MKLKITGDKKCLLCLVILYYTMFIGFFTWNFGLTETANYLPDLLILFLTVLSLYRVNSVFKMSEMKPFLLCMVLLLLVGTVSALFQQFHVGLWVWSLRNWGRMILFFCLCAINIDINELNKVLNFIIHLYDFNFLVILIQFFFLRSRYGVDQLNGLFGRNTSILITVMSLITFCIVMSAFLAKQYKLKRLVITLIEINAVAIMAELRGVFVFEVVLVLAYVLANMRLSVNKFAKYTGIVAVALVIAVVSTNWLGRIYPQFSNFFNIQRIIADASTKDGYGHTGYIDRLSAIPVINRYFFDRAGIGQKLFGIGMGNGEYSSFEFLQSSFYREYGTTFRYLNFTSASLYLETGMVGLVLYCLAFLSLLLHYFAKLRRKLHQSGLSPLYENIGFGCAIICLLFVIYNNIHRTDGSIVLAFFLAVPLIAERNEQSEKN